MLRYFGTGSDLFEQRSLAGGANSRRSDDLETTITTCCLVMHGAGRCMLLQCLCNIFLLIRSKNAESRNAHAHTQVRRREAEYATLSETFQQCITHRSQNPSLWAPPSLFQNLETFSAERDQKNQNNTAPNSPRGTPRSTSACTPSIPSVPELNTSQYRLESELVILKRFKELSCSFRRSL